MANPMAQKNKESLFIRMIRLIQQIFIDCLLSARHNRDRQGLLFNEWGEEAKPQITRDSVDLPVHWNLMKRKRQCPGDRPRNVNTVAPILPTTLRGAPFTGWVFCLGSLRPRSFMFWSKCSFCCSISQTSQWSQGKWKSIPFKLKSEFHLPEFLSE